jgi:hypothetical protein
MTEKMVTHCASGDREDGDNSHASGDREDGGTHASDDSDAESVMSDRLHQLLAKVFFLRLLKYLLQLFQVMVYALH